MRQKSQAELKFSLLTLIQFFKYQVKVFDTKISMRKLYI